MLSFSEILVVAAAGRGDVAAVRRAGELAVSGGGHLTVVAAADRLDWCCDQAGVVPSDRIGAGPGTLAAAVGDELHRFRYDLVMVAAGLRRTDPGLLGQILRHSPAPVWSASRSMAGGERVVVALDPAGPVPLARRLVEVAATVAGTEAAVDVVHAWDLAGEVALRRSAFVRLPGAEVDRQVAAEETARRDRLGELLARWPETSGWPVHLVRGAPRDAAARVAAELGAAVVVVGSVGRTGVGGLVVGNTADRLVADAPCSVVVVAAPGRAPEPVRDVRPSPRPPARLKLAGRATTRGEGPLMFSTIIVATDGSANARQAVRAAADIARANPGSRLHVVSAFRPIPVGEMRELAAELPDELRPLLHAYAGVESVLAGAKADLAAIGQEAELHELEGDPADAILALVDRLDADLVVVGSRGEGMAKRLVHGSVSTNVMHHAPCSVLVVKDDR
ncbi:MAG: universal stress protein [Acidimicrobiales bacterium]